MTETHITQRLTILLILLVVSTSYICSQEHEAVKLTIPNSTLKNLYRIDNGVYRSEQPTAQDFKALQAFGIKEVLNLRRYHSDNDEAKGTALLLHRIKSNAHSIDEKELIEALRIIHQRKGPILIHCHHGSDRTGVVIAMYRIVFQQVSKEDAIKEMKEGGFGFHSIFFNIPRLIRKADIGKIRSAVLETPHKTE